MNIWKTWRILTATGIIFGIGALWWWALFGMKPEIGTAAIVTSVGLLGIGVLGSIFEGL